MSDQLQQLSQMTCVVADSGDIQAIKQFTPVDATTNPTLLLKAASQPVYQPLLQQARRWALAKGGNEQAQLSHMTQQFSVLIGQEILNIIPGRISTEVDARLSFDRTATIAQARQLIALYQEAGITKDRVLIKIAATWEGIQAARQLEQEGIQCNLTLLFNFIQAAACAEAGVYLISPFVGRILDWYQQAQPEQDFSGANDPGVQSVKHIYNYYKAHGYRTIVMAASFRNIGEIQALAGCDRLTISPALMQELAEQKHPLVQQLHAGQAHTAQEKLIVTEADFRWQLNQDAMACEKLAQGIRQFAADQVKLEQLLANAS